MRHDRKLGLGVGGVGKGIDAELFDKHFGRDEELDAAENTAVVREVAGATSREHVKVEGVVHAHYERIRRARVNEMRNVESKGGVAFARVFAGEAAVDPDRGGVENSGKLNANGGADPAFGNIEIALIPSGAPILDERRLGLPGVWNGDGEPVVWSGIYGEPIPLHTSIFGIGAEEPFAVEAGRFGGAWSG